jgi:hypothetical protein
MAANAEAVPVSSTRKQAMVDFIFISRFGRRRCSLQGVRQIGLKLNGDFTAGL